MTSDPQVIAAFASRTAWPYLDFRMAMRFEVLVVDQKGVREIYLARLKSVRKRIAEIQQALREHETIDAPAFRSATAESLGGLMTRLKEVLENAQRLVRRLQLAEDLMRRGMESASHAYRQAIFIEQEHGQPSPEPEQPGEIRTPAQNPRRASKEDGAEARRLYRKIVLALHPDRNAEMDSLQFSLWLQAQDAHAKGDVAALRAILAQVNGCACSPETTGSELVEAIREAERQLAELRQVIAEQSLLASWRFTRASSVERNRRLGEAGKLIENDLTEALRDYAQLRQVCQNLEQAYRDEVFWRRAGVRGFDFFR